MERETQEPAGEAQVNATAARKRGRLPMIAALVAGLAVGGPAGLWVVGPRIHPASHAKPAATTQADGEHPIHLIDNVVVNPANSQGLRFLVVTIGVEVDSPEADKLLTARDAEVRDAVLGLLGRKTVGQLSDIAARDSLKVQLKKRIETVIPGHPIRHIYLPQFVIQ